MSTGSLPVERPSTLKWDEVKTILQELKVEDRVLPVCSRFEGHRF